MFSHLLASFVSDGKLMVVSSCLAVRATSFCLWLFSRPALSGWPSAIWPRRALEWFLCSFLLGVCQASWTCGSLIFAMSLPIIFSDSSMLHSLSPLLLELQYRAHWLLLRPQMVLLADLQASDGFFFLPHSICPFWSPWVISIHVFKVTDSFPVLSTVCRGAHKESSDLIQCFHF